MMREFCMPQVLKDGTYKSKSKSDKMTYGTMVFVRAMIVGGVAATWLGSGHVS